MSSIIQSESDDSSYSSSSSSLSSKSPLASDKVIKEEPRVEAKIPLSTSIILDKLPIDKQTQLNKIIKETEVKKDKITIRFQPIGSTPAIAPKVFKISSNQNVSTIIKFLTRKLKIKDNVIHLYVQNSFQPNPDENLGDLFNLFKINNELIINYCNAIAFG